jgi:hypothetical protein
MYELLPPKAIFSSDQMKQNAAAYGQHSACKLLIDLGADATHITSRGRYDDQFHLKSRSQTFA